MWPMVAEVAVLVNGNMCGCVGLLRAVTGSDMYPGTPDGTAFLMVGVVEEDADPV